VLLRAMRAQSDQAGLAVVATARDESLLRGYEAISFVPGEPGNKAARRFLYRPPDAGSTTRRAATNRRARRSVDRRCLRGQGIG